jgi:hypothetical protein
MKIHMFATSGKVKPNTEIVRGLIFAAVKRTTVQMTRLPLYHELHELGYRLLCQALDILYIRRGGLISLWLYKENNKLRD